MSVAEAHYQLSRGSLGTPGSSPAPEATLERGAPRVGKHCF